MPENETIFAFPSPDKKVTQSPQPAPASQCEKPPMELDMGEASREQGFRLFGCR